MLRHIILAAILAISINVPAATVDTSNTLEFTIEEVCLLMGGDGVTFAQMYKDGNTSEDIVNLIQTRIDNNPAMAYAIPGIKRILMFIENVKIHSPNMYNQPNFPTAAGIATRNVCLRSQAIGWTQNIPGTVYVLKPLQFPPSASPKVKM